ncbi:MAG: hypothetical protein HY804_08845 [Nitrospinae bacterium]|nr:hypothetical protein [Nitrospinota bacterium]
MIPRAAGEQEKLAQYARSIARAWRAEDLLNDIFQQSYLIFLARAPVIISNKYLYLLVKTAARDVLRAEGRWRSPPRVSIDSVSTQIAAAPLGEEADSILSILPADLRRTAARVAAGEAAGRDARALRRAGEASRAGQMPLPL